MFDFPNPPLTIGQTVLGSNGLTYTYDGVKWVSGSPAAQFVNNAGRNLLHNPYFNIQQRGAGPWTTTATYTADRWALNVSSDTASVNLIQATDGWRSVVGDDAVQYLLQNTFTGNAAAGAYNEIVHAIENVRRLGGKTVTLSFLASAGAALKLGINGYQSFGTGGSPSTAVSFSPTGTAVPITTSAARYSVTMTIPTTVGKTLGTNLGTDFTIIQIFFSSGTTNGPSAGNIGVQSGVVQLWGMQLEVGNVMTPLEKIDWMTDLQRCQRFYCPTQVAVNGLYAAAAGGQLYSSIYFPVPMRASATCVMLNNYGTTGSPTSFVSLTPLGCGVTVIANANAAGYNCMNFTITASADI
jgi:hypothetical protein